MQYVLSNRRTYISTVEFQNTTPILNIERLRFFSEIGLTGNFTKKEFRYSFDNVIWQPWQTFSNTNLSIIDFRDYTNFYIHVKYTRTSVIAGNIDLIYLTYDSKVITPPSPDSSIIDADRLQGKDGAYYLDRENQYGPFTDLQVHNILDASSAIGTYHSRSDTPLGTDLYFKSVAPGEGIKVYESSLGHDIVIETSINVVTSYDTTLDPALTMPEDVGGIPAGTAVSDLYGDSFTSLFDDLLFPTVYPTLTAPSAAFSINPTTTLYEFAANPSITFTTTFNRGSINPQYDADSPYRSGLPNNYDYTGTGLVDSSSSSLTNIQTINVSIGSSQSWSVQVGYNSGVQPYDSKGNPYDSSLAAGIVSASSSITIYGAYPLYATTSDINTLTKQTLVRMTTSPAPSSNGIILVAEPDESQRQKFEIPVAWPYTDLYGVQWYNTNNSQWEYIGDQNTPAQSLTFWNVTDSSEIIQGLNINYKRYTHTNAEKTGERKIRLIFS